MACDEQCLSNLNNRNRFRRHLVAPFVVLDRSYAMSNSAKPTSQPIIIVFGVSAIGKPRAGTFKGSDVPAARKAAAKLGLRVIDLIDEAGLALAAKVSAGRIGGSGDNIIPFVDKDLHGQ